MSSNNEDPVLPAGATSTSGDDTPRGTGSEEAPEPPPAWEREFQIRQRLMRVLPSLEGLGGLELQAHFDNMTAEQRHCLEMPSIQELDADGGFHRYRYDPDSGMLRDYTSGHHTDYLAGEMMTGAVSTPAHARARLGMHGLV